MRGGPGTTTIATGTATERNRERESGGPAERRAPSFQALPYGLRPAGLILSPMFGIMGGRNILSARVRWG